MKTKLQQLLRLLTLLAWVHHAAAQGTAFSYQGLLSANGAPANGSYDLAFTLYDSTNNPGNIIAGPLTNVATTVSNGVFTVMLDFGPGVFTGSNYWLDISVSPSGSNTFTELIPRSPLISVPYAVYATSANNVSGSISAGQLSGVVNNGQLANSFITVNSGPGVAGGGTVALGGSITLSNTGILSVSGNSDITVSTVSGQVTLGDTATSENTPGAIIQRDANGDFSAGTLTLSGTLNLGNYEFNTGVGLGAFGNNTSGWNNTSLGALAIGTGTTGEDNTAVGAFALVQSTAGDANTAIGTYSLLANTIGGYNTALGSQALVQNTTGSNNIAVGYQAGGNLTLGNSNIDIGNEGLAGDDSTIRIGTSQTQAYIAGVINGNGAGLTNINASQLAGGTIPLAQLPPGIITNSGSNVVLDGTFTEQGNPVLTNNAPAATLSGSFTGTLNGGGIGTNIFTNITVIGTNTPIWSADGNIYPPSWLNIYTGLNGGMTGIGLYGDFRGGGTNGERYAAIFGNEGDLLMTGPLLLNDDGHGVEGIPDFDSLVLEVADDVNHGIVQEASAGGVWAYQLFSSASGGNPTNGFYTNGMETMQILADGQINLLQPWQFEDGPHVNLLFAEAQPANEGKSTGKTNTFGMEVYNGLFNIGPVTGTGVNTNGTNWVGTNATITSGISMDTNGNLSAGTITASNFVGDGSGLTNLAPPYVTGYSSSLTIVSSTAYYLPLASGSASTTEEVVETPVTAGIHGGLYFGIYDLGAGTNVVFTIMTNGIPTGVTCSLTGNGAAAMQWCSDPTDSFTVDSNGLPASIRILADNHTSSSSMRVSWMLKY